MMNDAREELLSAYLDNCLSADELSHVERLLQSDASARKQLEELKALQMDLRASMKTDAQLGIDFSDRVWSAVLAQAEIDALPETHPVRLAQRHDESRKSKHFGKQTAWIGGLAALVASLILAFALNFDNDSLQNDLPPTDLLIAATPSNSPKNLSSVDDVNPSAKPAPEAILAAESGANMNPAKIQPSAIVAIESVQNGHPAELLPRIATNEPAVPEKGKLTTPGEASGTVDSLVGLGEGKLDIAVLLEVELTKRGRDLGELEYALETAGITSVKPQEMTRDHVGQLVRGDAIGAVNLDQPQNLQGDTQLLLLQGPSKRLDRFMLSLFNHPSVVKRVGLQLTMDSKLVAAIREISSANTRHSDTKALAHHLMYGAQGKSFPRSGHSGFVVLTEDNARRMKWTAEPPSDEGPDFQTQLLVLVRCPQ